MVLSLAFVTLKYLYLELLLLLVVVVFLSLRGWKGGVVK